MGSKLVAGWGIPLFVGASLAACLGNDPDDLCEDCGIASDGGARDPNMGGDGAVGPDPARDDGSIRADGSIPLDAGAPLPDASPDGGGVDPPPFAPLLRIPVRVHIGGGRGAAPSELTDEDLGAIFEEMNTIWYSQAGICFEFETTDGTATLLEEGQPGFDLWFTPTIPFQGFRRANGVYLGSRDDAWSRDEPGLNPAPNSVTHLAARTAAHELGHGLSLPHNDCQTGCQDFLMASGTRGWKLLEGRRESDGVPKQEISDSRIRAQRAGRNGQPLLALPDTTPLACAAPVFGPRG